ncbi:type I restriction-modification system subunit M [Mucilaginibacter terrae]|uniref:site-specific DNA-methyltransferase (adenine-specific) n=1 Tax=Mucilaginibacter terrae TaxID=1955052 RepID=A0ABU3GNJ9_9SPHI|nr:class I SAM-dependent DNA methyltransferase [Mucilaginibacter terrae]MDT3401061.1 type I restriction enzyme M protein [Mucilaginibacter terrae]
MKRLTPKVDVSFIFQITDRVLWNVFKKNEIGDVLLPFIVIRRLDCMLEPVNTKVHDKYDNIKNFESNENIDFQLRKAAGGLQFYNVSKHTLESLRAFPRNIEIDFINYLDGFNLEVREILENFQFEKIIGRLIKNKLLYQMIDAICQVDLHLNNVDNHTMGYIFEELIRISNEQSNETAGEHFTPRDVIDLMVNIVFSTEKRRLTQPGTQISIYDPTMGTGGMVNLAKKYILEEICSSSINKPEVNTYGQEINEQSYAIAKSEALITGENSDNIRHGNTFTEDRFQNKFFDYIFANPPYGVTWSKDADFIRNESVMHSGRFFAGLPSISDGQLLFIQHMISKMSPAGCRMAVVTNASPLFSGNAGSGESDIRKWLITNDFLECIIALPKDLFYNTGINTYLWFFNNKKSKIREGKVQLINANVADNSDTNVIGFSRPEKRSLGNKRNRIEPFHVERLLEIYSKFEEDEHCKIYNNEFFGYYQIVVEQPKYSVTGDKVIEKNGRIKADPKKRIKEIVPLNTDIDNYVKKEILPYFPDAYIDYDRTRIGYEINFTKYFYKFKQVRPSKEIKAEIEAIEFGNKDQAGIQELLRNLLKA